MIGESASRRVSTSDPTSDPMVDALKLRRTWGTRHGIKCEGPARTPGLSVFLCSIAYYFKYTGWRITHLPCWRKFDLVWMVDCGRVLHRFGGLTTNQEAAKKQIPSLRYGMTS